jgi:hypothetical protein
MDTHQISLPSNSKTFSSDSVEKDIEEGESEVHGTFLSLPHKIIEGKSLLNINEQKPLMNSKKGILYYLLDKKY